MKTKVPFLLVPISLFVGTVATKAQDVSLAEGLDTTGIIWESSQWPIQYPNYPPVLNPTTWQGVTTGSHDGTDTIYIELPEDGSVVYVDLISTIQGPAEISFWYKGADISRGHLNLWLGEVNSTLVELDLINDGNWNFAKFQFRQYSPMSFVFKARSEDPFEIWMDEFEIKTIFPPKITGLPEYFPIPTRHSKRLTVISESTGSTSFKWFRDDVEVPGETETSIVITAPEEEAVSIYRVEITDELGSVLSNPVTVDFIDPARVLDNESLTFVIEDSPSIIFSALFAKDENAYDGEDAIFLKDCTGCSEEQINEHVLTSNNIATEIEGPAILSFFYRDSLSVFVNDLSQKRSDNRFDYELEFGEWKQAYIPVPNQGINDIVWLAKRNLFNLDDSGYLDQVDVSQKPVILSTPEKQTTVAGLDLRLKYQFVSVGETTHKLLQGEETVLESINQPLSLKELTTNQSGIYQISISNEFGEETISDDIEIEVADTVGKAVEQPDLFWQYEGENLWLPQIFDTYDGEDAAMVSNPQNSYGAVFTNISGPAFISFWWKRPNELPNTTAHFRINDGEIIIQHPGDGWQQAKVLATGESIELKWLSGFLDRLQIEYLDDNPFRFWAFQQFESDEVLQNFEEIRDGDRDYDGFSNFLEWILNKNLDFPNGSQNFEIIEVDGEQYLGITFSRPAELGQYSIHLEATNNLTTWGKIEAVVSETFNPSNNTYTVTIRDIQPLGTGGRFIRLVVTDE